MAGTNRFIRKICKNSRSIPCSMTRVRILLALLLASKVGASSFGFSIHHRLSDPVRAILPANFPEKGSIDYFAAMSARDQIHGRRLSSGNDSSTPVTFIAGNTTHRMSQYGFLYYANVTIGTPGVNYLVALDTGSDLLWMPCDCISCYKSRPSEMKFNTYGLNSSSTGVKLPCSSDSCETRASCSTTPEQCPYKRSYLSENTSSSGYLVQDVLHLTTESHPSQPVNATITFGCGRIQTGIFLEAGIANGLFGLGMERISVPSILAEQNITANSFSMCFGPGHVGRISFGDKGSSNQSETPFVLQQYQIYFVSISQLVVGMNTSNVTAAVIFDTGTSFTYFTEPAYTIITQAFNSQVKDERFPANPRIPFEFCYKLSSCSSSIEIPSISMKMGGGSSFNVVNPLVVVSMSDRSCIYCLGIIKQEKISFSIIGGNSLVCNCTNMFFFLCDVFLQVKRVENFMYGHRIVFDREKKVMGWEESDCDYAFGPTSITPISPRNGSVDAIPQQPTSPTSKSKGHQLIKTRFNFWVLALFLLTIQ